jgi:methionyl-tRNA synthetase
MSGTFYITTPIYYVNAEPHLGHAYSTIVADVATRFHRLLGVPSRMQTGTDEHGDKIAQAAADQGITPRPTPTTSRPSSRPPGRPLTSPMTTSSAPPTRST